MAGMTVPPAGRLTSVRPGRLTSVLHVRGVFLPDETERDAWIVDGQPTF
jgi:hypothetical protein